MGDPPGGVTSAHLKASSGKKAFDWLPTWKNSVCSPVLWKGKETHTHTGPVDPVPFNAHPMFPHVSRLLSYSMSTR